MSVRSDYLSDTVLVVFDSVDVDRSFSCSLARDVYTMPAYLCSVAVIACFKPVQPPWLPRAMPLDDAVIGMWTLEVHIAQFSAR